jgi:hypothetical protein
MYKLFCAYPDAYKTEKNFEYEKELCELFAMQSGSKIWTFEYQNHSNTCPFHLRRSNGLAFLKLDKVVWISNASHFDL